MLNTFYINHVGNCEYKYYILTHDLFAFMRLGTHRMTLKKEYQEDS